MNEKFLKAYDAKSVEDNIYQKWENSGYFNPDKCIEDGVCESEAESFSIVLPPPNVTGTLHTGHAFMLAIEDTMVRFARMQGKKTLWVPGTDHAAISTESVVVKQIAKEGTTKFKLGREEFLKRVNEFAQNSHDTIIGQTKKMGASLDWSREAFTLDQPRQKAVYTAFKQMYEDGLIYRGDRIVNWDPKGQTTVSDDEVDREEEKTKFYYFKYGPFTISTARPETKFGDKYVVMHPDDTRFAEYKHGDTFELEWINGPITTTVIKDTAIDMEFGTGVMTITPWHSGIDFEIATRHGLDKEQIIDMYGKLLPIAGEFAGMKIEDAREKIVEKLNQKGLLVKVEENYVHQKAISQRTKATIEPQIMKQWWIDVNKKIPARGNLSLKELMLKAVREDGVSIIPERFEKIYFNWIENLRDWNISRQIWYGHQVPVWYDERNDPHLLKEQKIIFVRHGESKGNVNKVLSGQTDSPLTEKGRQQAKDAALLLKSERITKIISSDLSRAYNTAEIIKKELNISCDIESWKNLREIDPGEFTGMNTDGISPIIVKAFESKDGEYYEKFVKRVQEVLEQIKQIETDGTILVVSHNSFLSGLSSMIEGRPDKESMVQMRVNREFKNASTREYILQIPPKGSNMVQDQDTLDTWFSSGLWTFSTLGWPENTDDFKTYHPTSVLETGNDILFFWVARMILMSTYLLGDIPFKTVYMHGMVLDKNGKKMSKSKPETAVDPLLTVEKYGADALRMAMLVGVGPGQDVNLSEDKIRAYSKFSNKIWNGTRFVLENTEGFDMSIKPNLDAKHEEYINQWQNLTKEITKEMEEYKFYLVGEKLYHFFWHTFADVIIEELKNDMNDSAKYTLLYLLKEQLKALHPFMPFITEEIWSSLPNHDGPTSSKVERKLLMIEKWPTA